MGAINDRPDMSANVLYNDQAMAILADACERLRALGLHAGHGASIPMPGSEMAACLYVSTSQRALDMCAAGNLLADDYARTEAGRKHFDHVLSEQDDLGKWLEAGGALESKGA